MRKNPSNGSDVKHLVDVTTVAPASATVVWTMKAAIQTDSRCYAELNAGCMATCTQAPHNPTGPHTETWEVAGLHEETRHGHTRRSSAPSRCRSHEAYVAALATGLWLRRPVTLLYVQPLSPFFDVCKGT